MALTYDAWGNAQGQEQDGPGVWKERWVQGGPEGGTLEKYWESDAAAAAGDSTAYDFGRYSSDVSKLPTLAANDITRDANTGAWSYNRGNEYLNKAMTNADKGANYYGMAALLKGNQDYSAATGEGSYADTSRLSDATYRQLAGFMGIDANDPDMRSKVLEGANNYAMVKGMTGLNPGDPRASTQTLYQKQADGSWAPKLNYDWHEREKGSWFEEGGYGILAPLGVVGAGLVAGAAAGAAAGSSGGAAAGGAGAASTAGAGSAATGAGAAAAGTGAGTAGISGSIANALGLGAQWGSLSAVQQAAVLGALQGGAQGGLSGGGWEGVLKGAAMGGFTGGAGAWAGPAISGATGWSPAVSRAVGAAGIGGIRSGLSGGNPWAGAASAGVGSLVGSGLSGMGANGYFSGLGGNLAGGFAGNTVNSLMGGSGGGQRPGGMSTGYAPVSGTTAGGRSTGSGGGMAGGLSDLTMGEAGNAQFVRASGEAMQQEAALQALIERFKDDPEFMAKLKEEHPELVPA